MARQPPPLEPANLSPQAMEAGVVRLLKRIEEVENFDPAVEVQDPYAAIAPLKASIEEALSRTFGHRTIEYMRYKSAAVFSFPIYMGGTPPGEIVQGLTGSKNRSLALLRQAVQTLQERLSEHETIEDHGKTLDPHEINNNMNIFIVHGHEEGPKESIMRFLDAMGFTPIILHEQANRGQTIIEKFEAHADVGFAVVVLTPDDIGGQNGNLNPRARQNVILELGYFIGRLTRQRVCAVKAGDLEIPSDILGTVWIDYDAAGGWRRLLAAELEAAGYGIDWNLVMRRSR